jgi:hypothetical protein
MNIDNLSAILEEWRYHREMDLTFPGLPPALNRDAPWDDFDSHSYMEHNYSELRPDDKAIIAKVRDHFADHFQEGPSPLLSGIDVGAGANLYPALTLLPWCMDITLLERSAGNVEWLKGQRKGYAPNWDQFWDVLCERKDYADVVDPRKAFEANVHIEEGDLYSLPEHRWTIGTMFFVAESLSTSHEEYERAVSKFALALKPGAPFAAAFMENSVGYEVNGLPFPACRVNEDNVLASLSRYANEKDVAITRFDLPAGPVREGYTGMILACGRRAF